MLMPSEVIQKKERSREVMLTVTKKISKLLIHRKDHNCPMGMHFHILWN